MLYGGYINFHSALLLLPSFNRNIANMSAYAASVSDRKQNKNRRLKANGASKHKTVPIPVEEITITGLCLRQKIKHVIIFWFETYITLALGVLVIFYVYGRRLIKSRSLSNIDRNKNPYSQSSSPCKSGSYKDLSCVNGFSTTEETNKIRPPSCLEDPQLGTHKFIKIQGVKLHYVEAGAGRGRPTLLLLHGALDFWFTWRKLVPALARRFRVICLDLRGCGDSEKPLLRSSYKLSLLTEDVASFIRTVGDPVHDGTGGVSLVCSGWGGQVGWSVAKSYPGLIRKMVQIHAPHPHVLRSYCRASVRNYYKLWPLLFARIPRLPEWAGSEDNLRLISRLLEPLVASKDVTEEEVEAYYYNFSRPEDITGALHHVRNWDLWAWGADIGVPRVLSTPTLLLMGDADPYIPLEAGYKSAEYVERIKTRVLVGATSWAAVTHSTGILEEMAAFFGEPRIMDDRYCSSDDDWDQEDDEDDEDLGSRSSLVGRMMGAGLSVVSRWNGKYEHR